MKRERINSRSQVNSQKLFQCILQSVNASPYQKVISVTTPDQRVLTLLIIVNFTFDFKNKVLFPHPLRNQNNKR